MGKVLFETLRLGKPYMYKSMSWSEPNWQWIVDTMFASADTPPFGETIQIWPKSAARYGRSDGCTACGCFSSYRDQDNIILRISQMFGTEWSVIYDSSRHITLPINLPEVGRLNKHRFAEIFKNVYFNKKRYIVILHNTIRLCLFRSTTWACLQRSANGSRRLWNQAKCQQEQSWGQTFCLPWTETGRAPWQFKKQHWPSTHLPQQFKKSGLVMGRRGSMPHWTGRSGTHLLLPPRRQATWKHVL